ncbi:hypothetical protein SGPA1_50701 [Streptomyces misionensis JCM 4497]
MDLITRVDRLHDHFSLRGNAHAHTCHRGRRLRRPGALRPRRAHRPGGRHDGPQRHLLEDEGERRQGHHRRGHLHGQGQGDLHRHAPQHPFHVRHRHRPGALPRHLGQGRRQRVHQRRPGHLHQGRRHDRELLGHPRRHGRRPVRLRRRHLEGGRARRQHLRRLEVAERPGHHPGPPRRQAHRRRHPRAGQEGQDAHRHRQADPRRLDQGHLRRLLRPVRQAPVPQGGHQHLHHRQDDHLVLDGRPEDHGHGRVRRLLPLQLRGHLHHLVRLRRGRLRRRAVGP